MQTYTIATKVTKQRMYNYIIKCILYKYISKIFKNFKSQKCIKYILWWMHACMHSRQYTRIIKIN